MNKQDSSFNSADKAWDTYWQGTTESSAYSDGGVNHPAIGAFWQSQFSKLKFLLSPTETLSILDIASGNGALIELAHQQFAEESMVITSLDVSESAIRNIQNRFPHVRGLIKDAGAITADIGKFDLVVSQFGIEYAGRNAIPPIFELVHNGGSVILVMHYRNGVIFNECMDNLNAIEGLIDSKFIALARTMFSNCFNAIKTGNRAPYEESGRQLGPAISQLEKIMNQYGKHVAGDTICKLYNDVWKIHQQVQHYDPLEIQTWLNRMEKEVDAYRHRMQSMCDSALTEQDIERLKSNLVNQDFAIDIADSLFSVDQQLPLAWVIKATRIN